MSFIVNDRPDVTVAVDEWQTKIAFPCENWKTFTHNCDFRPERYYTETPKKTDIHNLRFVSVSEFRLFCIGFAIQ